MSSKTVRIHVTTTGAHHWAYSLDGAADVHMPPGATYVDLNMAQVKPVESGDIVGFVRFPGQATRTPNVFPAPERTIAGNSRTGGFTFEPTKAEKAQNEQAANAVAKTNTCDLSIHMFRMFDGCSKIQSSDGAEHDAVPHANNTDFGIPSPTVASETNFLNPGFEISGNVPLEANDGMYVYQPEWSNQVILASTGTLRDETGAVDTNYRNYLRDFDFIRNLSQGFTVNLNGAQHNITIRTPRDNMEQYNSNWIVSDSQLKYTTRTVRVTVTKSSGETYTQAAPIGSPLYNRFNNRSLFTETDRNRGYSERVHSHQFVEFYELVAE